MFSQELPSSDEVPADRRHEAPVSLSGAHHMTKTGV